MTTLLRRLIALVATTWLVTLIPSTAGAQPETAAEKPWALLLGDSNMYGSFGHNLTRELRTLGYRVRLKGRPGSGLARPDFWDWEQHGRRLVERYRPSLVLIILGGNDGQRLRWSDGSYKDGIPWSLELLWNFEYGRRVVALANALMTDATPATRRVFILSPTNRRPPRARKRIQRIRNVQRSVLSWRDDVVWIDTYRLSSDATGRYLLYAHDARGRRLRLRRRDGIHLTPQGAAKLATDLLPTLAQYMNWHQSPSTQRH